MIGAYITFHVPGPVVPKARARVVRARGKVLAFTPKGTADFEERVAWYGLRARQKLPRWALGERYRVELNVARADRRRCDVDNVAKAVLDGLIGILWADDDQVDELLVRRCAGAEGVIVEVAPC